MTQGESTGMKRAQVVFEVVAGVLPGTPIEEYTKRWAFSRSELEADEEANAYQEAQAAAEAYAESLRVPSRLNWVRLDWIWL